MYILLQLNIAYPATGCQKLVEIDDEKKLRPFYEKRMATEVPADSLGDEWKVCSIDCTVWGSLFRIITEIMGWWGSLMACCLPNPYA